AAGRTVGRPGMTRAPLSPQDRAPLSPQDPEELPSDEHYARNLIAGRWQFPAAPYEYEIRSPADSTVTTVVPLSSRIDVARAVDAATQAAPRWAADHLERGRLLTQLVDAIDRNAEPLATLQSTETGLAHADSRATVAGIVGLAQAILPDPA